MFVGQENAVVISENEFSIHVLDGIVVRFEGDEWIQYAVGMETQSHGYGVGGETLQCGGKAVVI